MQSPPKDVDVIELDPNYQKTSHGLLGRWHIKYHNRFQCSKLVDLRFHYPLNKETTNIKLSFKWQAVSRSSILMPYIPPPLTDANITLTHWERERELFITIKITGFIKNWTGHRKFHSFTSGNLVLLLLLLGADTHAPTNVYIEMPLGCQLLWD